MSTAIPGQRRLRVAPPRTVLLGVSACTGHWGDRLRAARNEYSRKGEHRNHSRHPTVLKRQTPTARAAHRGETKIRRTPNIRGSDQFVAVCRAALRLKLVNGTRPRCRPIRYGTRRNIAGITASSRYGIRGDDCARGPLFPYEDTAIIACCGFAQKPLAYCQPHRRSDAGRASFPRPKSPRRRQQNAWL